MIVTGTIDGKKPFKKEDKKTLTDGSSEIHDALMQQATLFSTTYISLSKHVAGRARDKVVVPTKQIIVGQLYF